MTEALPNELLLKLFDCILLENCCKYLWKIRTTCKKWNVLIPVAISDHVQSRFGNDLKFEIKMEYSQNSIHFDSKFETFEDTCTFRLKKLKSLTNEDNNLCLNPGETCCAIILDIYVKKVVKLGWNTKEYIPTLILDENPYDIKQAKFGMGMILGYKLIPCTDILADDVFKLRVNNKNNSENSNKVRVSGVIERESDSFASSDSTSTSGDDTTVHTSVASSTGAELVYLNVPRRVLLELIDTLDHLDVSENFGSISEHVRSGSKFPFSGKFYKIKTYEDVIGNPYQRRSLI